MFRKLYRNLILTAFLAAAAWPANAGIITDPSGDSGTAFGGTPDIVSAEITVASGIANFSVRLSPGNFDPGPGEGQTWISWTLDTDQNPATGFPGVDSLGNDSALIGADFLINSRGSNAELRDGNTFATLGNFVTTLVADGLDFAIPLSALGNDDGFLNFKVSGSVTTAGGFPSAIQEYASDIGLPVGTVSPVPLPAGIWLFLSALFGLTLLRRARS